LPVLYMMAVGRGMPTAVGSRAFVGRWGLAGRLTLASLLLLLLEPISPASAAAGAAADREAGAAAAAAQCEASSQCEAQPKSGVDPCGDLHVAPPQGRPAPPAEEGEVVLVTGGSGFIGSHLVEALLRLGYVVHVLDNLETGNLMFLDLRHPRLHFFHGDIMDEVALRRAMTGVRGVFHLGAASKVLPSLKNPAMGTFNIERNAVGTSRVLEIANETQLVRKVLYAASSTYYGNQGVPFAEDDPFVPTSPYAASKYMGELAMATNDKVYNLHTLSLRFFMVYGPRNPAHGAYAIVTGKFIERMRQGQPLLIEGTGDNFRDFVHVRDVVRALILGYQGDLHGTVVNVGTGTTHSVKEVADLVSDHQQHVEARKNDLLGTMADTCRAKRLLHFEAEYDFVETMRKMIAAATSGDSAGDIAPMWTQPEVLDALTSLRIDLREARSLQERSALLRAKVGADPGFLDSLLRTLPSS